MSKTDYRLVIESARGEMKRTDQKDGIEILAFEYSADVPHDVTSGQATGRRRYSAVTFSKIVDLSSPAIQTMLATHSPIRKATLTCFKAGNDAQMLKFYEVIWTDAFISSYKIRGERLQDEFAALPRDEFTITFRAVDVTYTLQSSAGRNDGVTTFKDDLHAGR